MNKNRENGENRFAYLVNAPMIIYLACFLAFPMVWGLYMSFTNKTIGNPASFVGFKNYIRLLGDAEYRRSILNTVFFTAVSILVKTVLGMLMALSLNQKFKGRNIARALLMIPWTLPNIVVVYNWRWIFNSTGGIANYILKSLHITNTDIIWFGSAGLAMTTIIVANVWRGTPFFGVSILAKLQTIPKDYYEAAEMALIDTDVKRTFATGIAGFSHVVDSLSAIKYAKVKTIRDESGIVVDYETEGEFPKYGNDDDRADDIAVWLLRTFLEKIKKRHTYRDSEPTTSILTITSNVVYGKYTGAMPDGRKAGTPLAPGANPSYGAEQNGLLASLNSLTKLPYEWALDGISNTQTMNPDALGHNEEERVANLVNVMDGYFDQGAHHLNVNVFGKDKLLDAMAHPEKPEYANFTIRVSGYAVKFIDLTKEQQMDVISRTFHDHM